MSAEPDSTIPEGWQETMEENNWSEEEREAWRTLHEAKEGDLVLWADRTVGMRVKDVEQDEEGHHVMYVEKPRADGTYEVHERYHKGNLRLTSPIGRANDLHFVERAPEPRGLTEDEFEDLVDTLTENALDAFMRMDYSDWESAVSDVVNQWAEDVSFRRWRGYKHHGDWEDGDPEAIFESVFEHHTEDGDLPDEMPGGTNEGDLTPRERAEVVLFNRIYSTGREQAEASLVSDDEDYDETVETLAHHTVDRYDRKSYDDARVATRDTISDWVDDRGDPAFQSIIEYGNDRFDDEDYADIPMDDLPREKAFDILDHEVWERVQELQRERGEHDPTLRGLTYTHYKDLVDHLTAQVLRRYDGRGFLRTTVNNVVEEWADEVDAEEWEGHRHRVYAAGDVEDIFGSVAIHADADPFVWNPFSSNVERKMAVQALQADVSEAASRALDSEDAEPAATPVDEYVSDQLGADDVTYRDLAENNDPEEFVRQALSAADGDEVGWTFAEEILEHGGTIPESTNDWILVDYGIISEGEQLRKLAWFNRENGNVLVLSGKAAAPPSELSEVDEPYEGFHVSHHDFDGDEPEFLLSDVTLEEALTFVYDYLDADRADFRVIEGEDDVWVQDAINEDDLNATGLLDALIPNMGLGSDDVKLLGNSVGTRVGKWLRYWGPELKDLTAWAVLAWAPGWASERLDGVKVEPNMHKKHGVGVHISKEFGKAPYQQGVGGKANVDLNVRPQTFRNLGRRTTPEFIKEGFSEGDLGKATARRIYNATTGGPWRREFVDTFVMSEGWRNKMGKKFQSGVSDDLPDPKEMQREFVAEVRGIPESEVELPEDWNDLAPEVKQDYGDYIDEQTEASWENFESVDASIPALFMRALDAEATVKGARWLNIDNWLQDTFTFYGSDYATGPPPTFEEWQEERYGPGQPAGPEEEARRRARFHKEVAAAEEEPPDPYMALGVDDDMQGQIEDQPDELGDYNHWRYDFDDTFGNSFDEVSDKFASDEPVSDDHEYEQGHE